MRMPVAVSLAVCLLFAGAPAPAAVPNAVSYQGRLLDSGGSPVADGSYNMVFTIWDAPAGGSALWTSGVVSVPVVDGLFSVNLGEPPMAVLPPTIAADSARWLGVTVGADPEISPRTKLVSSLFSLNGGGGALDDLYVNELGDTLTGTLVITDSIAVGTTTFEAPMTFRSYDRWSPLIGNGLGDWRLTNGTHGFSIGIAAGGGGAGHVRMWPSGGSQLVTISTPGSGDQFTVDGNFDHVWTGSPFSVNTAQNLAPLTVGSADNWRWDIGSGLGDFRLADGGGKGLSIGVASAGGGAGAVSFWASGGLVEDIHFGSPTFGNIFQIYGITGQTRFNSPLTSWYHTGIRRVYIDATQGTLLVQDSVGSGKAYIYGGPAGAISVYDEDYTSTALLWGGATAGGHLFLERSDGNAGLTAWGGNAGAAQGGILHIYDGTGSLVPTIELNGAAVGDIAAIFPQDAVNSNELLDEPGIATTRQSVTVALTPSSTSNDFISVTITTPSSGYIVVEGTCFHSITGTGSAFAWVQISETSDRVREVGHFNWTGSFNFANAASGYGYFTTPVRRVYSKAAGTYTFYMQGNLWESNAVGVTGTSQTPSWLQATFYPTSYGTVQTIVAEAGDNPETSPITLDDPQTGQQSSVYVADLRYYERKAREAELAELKARNARLAAQLELARATARQAAPRPLDQQ